MKSSACTELHVINMYTAWGVEMSHPTGDGYAQASLDRQHTMERRYHHHPRIEYWPLLVEGTEEISRMKVTAYDSTGNTIISAERTRVLRDASDNTVPTIPIGYPRQTLSDTMNTNRRHSNSDFRGQQQQHGSGDYGNTSNQWLDQSQSQNRSPDLPEIYYDRRVEYLFPAPGTYNIASSEDHSRYSTADSAYIQTKQVGTRGVPSSGF
ncbi:hypothetical protein BDD12DRAFT_225135 [Trichophaea hybrida]|nr:hypothetical protein BDD12DRAFT_225135 [Trichophaea hybrida]